MLSQEQLVMLRTVVPPDWVRSELTGAAPGEQILGPMPEGVVILDRAIMFTGEVIEKMAKDHERKHASGTATGLLDCLFFHQDMAEGMRHVENLRTILAGELYESFQVGGDLALRKEGVVLLPKAQNSVPTAEKVEKS